MIRYLRNIFSRQVRDLEVGDLVKRVGFWGTGVIESRNEDFAVVAWNKDRRDILPLYSIRRTRAGGHHLDRRDA